MWSLLLSLSALAAPPHLEARDRALEALLAGDAAGALRGLERDRAKVAAAHLADHDCLSGRVALLAGQLKQAEQIFGRVPEEASCGARARFELAELAAAQGGAAQAERLMAKQAELRLSQAGRERILGLLDGLARQLMQRPRPATGPAIQLRSAMASLVEDPQRKVQIALMQVEELREEARRGRAWTSALPPELILPLRAALGAASPEPPALRLALAQARRDGALLDPLPDSPEKRLWRLRLASASERDLALAELLALADDGPGLAFLQGPEGEAAVEELLQGAEGARRLDLKLKALTLKAKLQPEQAPALRLEIIELLERRGQWEAMGAAMEEWRQAHGSHPLRPRVEAAEERRRKGRALQAWAAGRPAEASRELEELLRSLPPEQLKPELLLLASRAAAESGAERRTEQLWEELRLRFPQSEQAALATALLSRRKGAASPEAADAFLEAERKKGGLLGMAAAEELERRARTDLALEVEGRQPPRGVARLRLSSRNLAEVELKLHRIDAEAFLRSGSPALALAELDVGIVAPDRRWTQRIQTAPRGLDSLQELEVKLPGPGFWAITASSPREEARVVVASTGLELVGALRPGGLSAVALREGSPVRGLRYLIWADGQIIEARPDRDGLLRLPTEAAAVHLLALDGAEPALLDLERGSGGQALEPTTRVMVDLDRPTWQLGDAVGFRLSLRRDGAPLRGSLKVWLQGRNGASGPPQELELDAWGAAWGELWLPPELSTGMESSGWQLMGQLPGEASPRALAPLELRPSTEGQAELRGEALPDGRGLFHLTDADGRPRARGQLRWAMSGAEGLIEVDERGRAALPAGPVGLQEGWSVALAGGSARASLSPMAPAAEPDLPARHQRRRAPGQTLDEPGLLLRELPALPTLAAPRDPMDVEQGLQLQPAEEPGGIGWWEEAGPGPLQVGQHRLLRLERSGRSGEPLELEVAEGLRLAPLPLKLRSGEALTVGVQGEAALVVVEGLPAEWSAWMVPGQTADVPLPAGLGGGLTVRALPLRGAPQEHSIELDPSLEVKMSRQGQRLELQLQDSAGRGVAGQVVLRLVDALLHSRVPGQRWRLESLMQRSLPGGDSAGGVFSSWRHGSPSTPISGALLAEAAREAERQTARSARDGNLLDNRAAVALESQSLLIMEDAAVGMGGLGTHGRGSGGSGYGRGEGNLGGVGGKAVASAAGHRGRVLWERHETDAQGRLRVELPPLPHAGQWVLEARALSKESLGLGSLVVEGAELAQAAPRAPTPPADPIARAALELPVSIDARDLAALADAAQAALEGANPADQAVLQDRRDQMVLGMRQLGPALLSRAGALRAMAALRAPLGLVAGDIAPYAPPSSEGAGLGTIAAQLLATAQAGLPVEDSVVDRLLRSAPSLQDEESSRLARLLLLRQRRAEALPLIRGSGVQAGLARREAGLPPGPLLSPIPPAGDPERADWLRLARHLGPSQLPAALWTPEPLPTGGKEPLLAWRVPPREDGQLQLRSSWETSDAEALCSPCVLAPGDGLLVRARIPSGWQLPEGLRLLEVGASELWLQAASPGEWTLRGLRQPRGAPDDLAQDLVVRTGGEPSPVARGRLLHIAEGALEPERWIGQWPELEQWPVQLRAGLATLRWERRPKDAPPAQLIARFEDLRLSSPEASLRPEDLPLIARAYAATGRPERALTAWRAALDLRLQADAAPLTEVERDLGTLAAARTLRDLVQVYPVLPAVEEALYQLPERVAAMAEGPLPEALRAESITPTDLRLLASAWDREFIALYPQSPHVEKAAFHMLLGLLELEADQRALDQSRRLSARLPQSPLRDSFDLVGAIAATRLGEGREAQRIYEGLASGTYAQPDGHSGPSELSAEARLALARLAEARGDLAAAIEAYRGVEGQAAEARRARQDLERQQLVVPELLRQAPGGRAALTVEVANAPELHARAYRLDLRTLYLRDGGLEGALEVAVSGLSPEWSGKVRGGAGPSRRPVEVELPLRGSGAWLVELEAAGELRRSLLVRSDLMLQAEAVDGLTRLRITHGDLRPAPYVELRVITNGQISVARTDARGVAEVPAGSSVLAFAGEDLAFTDGPVGAPRGGPLPAPDAWAPLKKQLQEQRQEVNQEYEDAWDGNMEAVKAMAL